MRTLFDTQKYISTIKAGGMGDDEAHAMSNALQGALNEGVATSDDLVKSSVRIDLMAARVDVLTVRVQALNDKIDGMAGNLNDKIDGMAGNLNDKIMALNDKIDRVARNLEDKIAALNHKVDGVARNLEDKIGGLNDKIDTLERNLRTEMDARFHVHKVWLMIIAAMVAFSNPLMMHFYKAIGILP